MKRQRSNSVGKAVVVMQKPMKKKQAFVKGPIPKKGSLKELKYVDLASATYVADTTGTVTALNLIAVGDDNTNRDGRQVCIKSVQIRGFVSPTDTGTAFSRARVLLVWDNAVNSGSIATVAQILSAASANSFPLIDNANRFTILADRSYAMGAVDTTASMSYSGSPNVHDVDIYKKINQITQFSGTTAAIGSIQNGGLLMVTIGSAGAGAGANFSLATRVRFTDD